MYKKLILFSVIFSSFNTFSQIVNDSNVRLLFRNVIETLAHDSMLGRETGKESIDKSLNYLHSALMIYANKKLEVQPFTILKNDSVILAKNAYCFVNNHSQYTLIIGAHYDHIGFGGKLSKSFSNNQIHNGADDNASGVAMVISLAQVLSVKSATVNYMFVFYSGHEIGLYGSDAFYEWMINNKIRFGTIDRVLNFDMVGRMDKNTNILRCTSFPSEDSMFISCSTNSYGIQLKKGVSETLIQLDTKPFVTNGISSNNFSTGTHLDYHKTTDDAAYINYQGMENIYNFLLEVLMKKYCKIDEKN